MGNSNFAGWLGLRLAQFLAQPSHAHTTAPPTDPGFLLATLRPADVVLVEGNSRFSTAIKYLTQSTWSHAALYAGLQPRSKNQVPEPCFLEADVVAGVRLVGIEAFAGYHVRICRAIGLDGPDAARVIDFAFARLGAQYDLRHVLDLARYLLPTPPVPVRLRRRMIAFGAGDPTRAICSTLIAEAFQSVHYPILPVISREFSHAQDCPGCVEEILQIRDHHLFVPRDFDVSPYFEVLKPELAGGRAMIEAARRAIGPAQSDPVAGPQGGFAALNALAHRSGASGPEPCARGAGQ